MEKVDTVRTETEALLKKIVSQYTLEVVEDTGSFQIAIPYRETWRNCPCISKNSRSDVIPGV